MHIRLFNLSGRWFPIVLWLMAADMAFGRAYFVALNLTESLPGTIFLVEKGVMPQRGELVAFRWEPNWPYPHGSIFVKKLVGLPGSVVTAKGRDFFVDGTHPDSLDSRYLLTGWIGQHQIVGKAYRIF